MQAVMCKFVACNTDIQAASTNTATAVSNMYAVHFKHATAIDTGPRAMGQDRAAKLKRLSHVICCKTQITYTTSTDGCK